MYTMKPNYAQFLNATLAQASSVARANFGKVSGTTKPEDNNQVLTSTDLEIGNLIISTIQEAYPEHNIIDEEAGVIDQGSRLTWVVDPIDGTSNFAEGVETYGIMIGLLEDEVPVAGGIALPSFDKIVVAEKGQGCFIGNKKIHVSNQTNLLMSLVAYGIDGHQEDPEITRRETKVLGEIVLASRNLRSSNSAFDAVMVAEGRYGATLNRTSKIWDNVAPQIVIQEAGGIYTAYDGSALNYAHALHRTNDNFTWCAGAPALHPILQDIIQHDYE
jgi:myo-inositol-1(or 4)-monophosphatase